MGDANHYFTFGARYKFVNKGLSACRVSLLRRRHSRPTPTPTPTVSPRLFGELPCLDSPPVSPDTLVTTSDVSEM